VECLWIGIPLPLIKDGFFALHHLFSVYRFPNFHIFRQFPFQIPYNLDHFFQFSITFNNSFLPFQFPYPSIFTTCYPFPEIFTSFPYPQNRANSHWNSNLICILWYQTTVQNLKYVLKLYLETIGGGQRDGRTHTHQTKRRVRRFVWFRFDRIRFVSFDFVSFGFVSFLFRIALYRYPIRGYVIFYWFHCLHLNLTWLVNKLVQILPGYSCWFGIKQQPLTHSETERNEIKRNETNPIETKSNETTLHFVSFRSVSFRFVRFRFYFVLHFTGNLFWQLV
jgi:hypothetical protein